MSKWRIQIFDPVTDKEVDDEIETDSKIMRWLVEAMVEKDEYLDRVREYVLTPITHKRVTSARIPEIE